MAAEPKLVKHGPKYPIFPDKTRESKTELLTVKNFNLLVVSPPAGGKTNFVVAMLTGPYRRKFRYIFYISPTNPDAKVEKLKLDEGRFADNLEAIDEFMELAGGERSCIVIDDGTSMVKNDKVCAYSIALTAGHHMNCSTITCVHNLSSCPPLIKKSAHAITLARGIPTAELRSLEPYLKGGLTLDQLKIAYRMAEGKSLPLTIKQDGSLLIGFDTYQI